MEQNIKYTEYYECSGCFNVTTKAKMMQVTVRPDRCRHCGSELRPMTEKEIDQMISEYETKPQFNSLEKIANGY